MVLPAQPYFLGALIDIPYAVANGHGYFEKLRHIVKQIQVFDVELE